MKTAALALFALVVFALHQDFWNWKAHEPLVFGFLPIGLAYHAGFSILCAVMMAVFALLLKPLEGTALLRIFMIAFVGFNIGYLWIRKDAQFEDRAAPTTELIAALGRHMSQRTLVSDGRLHLGDVESPIVAKEKLKVKKDGTRQRTYKFRSPDNTDVVIVRTDATSTSAADFTITKLKPKLFKREVPKSDVSGITAQVVEPD